MPTDPVKYGPRAPRQPGEYSHTVPLAFLEIPSPDPAQAVGITDMAAGIIENAESRGITILFNGEPGSVQVGHNVSGHSGDLSTAVMATFRTQSPFQSEAVSPLGILRITEDPSGGWNPVLSRGACYRVWQMTADESEDSWLRAAGFVNGQYLALGYTSELDALVQSTAASWTGTAMTGGGGFWNGRQAASTAVNSRTVKILPDGLSAGNGQGTFLALGGLCTDSGVELLAEPPLYSTEDVLLAPGNSNLPLHEMAVSVFDASGTDPVQGRLQNATPFGSANLDVFSSATAGSYLAACTTDGKVRQASGCVIQFSGSVYAPQEGFYEFNFYHGGKIRFYHWNLPVIDRWYGLPVPAARNSAYCAYLHAGWHDILFSWAPDAATDYVAFTATGPSSPVFAANTTTRSQVQAVDTIQSQITLKQSYLGTQSADPPQILASYASAPTALDYRGYRNDAGGFVGLDLNPAAGRVYGVDNGTALPDRAPTLNWVFNQACWLYALPVLACALTDASGIPLSTGQRNWETCMAQAVYSALRWSIVAGTDSLESGVSTVSPLGTSSSFGSAAFGSATYSASGYVSGISGQPDPRGGYDSAIVLGHLNVVNGVTDLSSIRIHDVRSRGGGLFQETVPANLPAGGPRERARVFWDESPWDGYEGSVDGIALFEVPKSVLDGSDGGPVYTQAEVEELAQRSVAAGIRPVILYID